VWRRRVGCLELHVIFRRTATNYRALLQKMTYKDKASYGSSPPCSKLSRELKYCSRAVASVANCSTLSSKLPLEKYLPNLQKRRASRRNKRTTKRDLLVFTTPQIGPEKEIDAPAQIAKMQGLLRKEEGCQT